MRVVVFKHPSDLLELKNLLYGNSECQQRGLAKCKAYQTRGPLPPSVHLTCQLIAAIHADLPTVDLYAIRLTYSMALIRFVNEILDSEQQGKSVVPLYALAQMADLPAAFVELRHAATHEDLPSVYLLREMANRALAFLWEKFWSIQKDVTPSNAAANASMFNPQCNVKDMLREWRRIKRNDSRALPPTELITALRLKWEENEEEFRNVMLTQNVLVPANSSSPSAIIMLYLPVFQSLGSRFCLQLLKDVLQVLQGREWPTSSTDIREKKQFPIFQAWAEVLAKYLDVETANSLSGIARPWNALILAKYSFAHNNKVLYDVAKEMAEFTDCEHIPEWEPGWKVLSGWTQKPLGIYI